MLYTWNKYYKSTVFQQQQQKETISLQIYDYYLPRSGIQGAMVTFQEQSLTD